MENHNLICINTVGSIVGEENTYPYIECENFSDISLKEKLQSGKLSAFVSNFGVSTILYNKFNSLRI